MKPEELKQIRLKEGLSQPKFAALTGITKQTLYRYETGKSAIPYAYEFLVKTKYVN